MFVYARMYVSGLRNESCVMRTSVSSLRMRAKWTTPERERETTKSTGDHTVPFFF